MRDLNKVMLIGNLTRDPELRTIPSGQNVATFTIATNRSWNDAAGELQTAVEYNDIVAWGKLSEIVGQILTSHLNNPQLRKLLTSLYLKKLDKDYNYQKFKKLIKRADRITKRRNEIVHSLWAAGNKPETITQLRKS